PRIRSPRSQLRPPRRARRAGPRHPPPSPSATRPTPGPNRRIPHMVTADHCPPKHLRVPESTSINPANVEQAARVEGTRAEHRAATDPTLKGASEPRRERRVGEASAEQAAVSNRSSDPRKQ